MKKKYLCFFFLLLPLSELWAGINIDTTYTHGPSQYHEIAANVYLTTPDNHLTVQVGSILSQDSINTETSTLYVLGLDVPLTKEVGVWFSYNFSPEYSYEALVATITTGGYYWATSLPVNFNNDTISGGVKFSFYGLNNKNKDTFFKTTFDSSLSNTRYKYDITKQFKFFRRTITKTYEYEFKQNNYTLGLAETLGGITTISYYYSGYDYSEDPLLLPPNWKAIGIQGGVLPGFPQYTNQINLSQELFNLFSVGIGYAETQSKQYLLSENTISQEDSTFSDILSSVSAPIDILSISYNASLDYYFSQHLTLYATYNLNKDSTGVRSKYISTGLAYSF